MRDDGEDIAVSETFSIQAIDLRLNLGDDHVLACMLNVRFSAMMLSTARYR